MIEAYVTGRKSAPPKYKSDAVDRLFAALQKKGLGDGPNTIATVLYYFGKGALLTGPDESTAKKLKKLSSQRDSGEVKHVPDEDGRPFRSFRHATPSAFPAGSLWVDRKGRSEFEARGLRGQ